LYRTPLQFDYNTYFLLLPTNTNRSMSLLARMIAQAQILPLSLQLRRSRLCFSSTYVMSLSTACQSTCCETNPNPEGLPCSRHRLSQILTGKEEDTSLFPSSLHIEELATMSGFFTKIGKLVLYLPSVHTERTESLISPPLLRQPFPHTEQHTART
jgi:hypothetical protein